MDYVVYKQRWIILAGVLACSFIRGYLPSMFAISNDIMTTYFRITPLQADMLTSADTAVAVVACLMTSVVGNGVGVRLLSLTTAVSFVSCSVAIGIAITGRDLYTLMLAGRLLSGISAAVLYILPPILGNAWFPSSQVGTAASIPVAAMCIGGLISPTIFSNLLPKVNETDATYNSSELSTTDDESSHLQKVVICNMAVFLALSIISIGIFCVFAKNNPPTPPSGAQAQLLKNRNNGNSMPNLRENFRTIGMIVKLRSTWIVGLITVTSASSLAFSVYLQPSMLKATFVSASNSVAGYCMVLSVVCGVFGSVAAGKILDKWHAYKMSCLLGLLCICGSSLAIYFSHVRGIISVFFIFHAIVGFFRLFNYVCVAELMLEVTYPQNRTVATCLFFAFYNLWTFLWTPLERWVMARFGEEYVALVVLISQLAAAGITLLWRPQYKRTLANIKKVEDLERELTASKLLSGDTA